MHHTVSAPTDPLGAPPPGCARGRRGFSLVEVMIALALAALALLLSLSLLWQQPRVLERLEARRLVSGVLETAMETLRAGSIAGAIHLGPLTEEEIEWEVPPGPELPPQFALRLAVAETGEEDLFDVVMVASWRLQNRRFEQTLHTLVWQP